MANLERDRKWIQETVCALVKKTSGLVTRETLCACLRSEFFKSVLRVLVRTKHVVPQRSTVVTMGVLKNAAAHRSSLAVFAVCHLFFLSLCARV